MNITMQVPVSPFLNLAAVQNRLLSDIGTVRRWLRPVLRGNIVSATGYVTYMAGMSYCSVSVTSVYMKPIDIY